MSVCLISLWTFASCTDESWESGNLQEEKNRIALSGEIDQVAKSRVNDSGFCDGDVMGVYIVDYANEAPGVLQDKGNRADNMRLTYDENAQKWNSAYDVYWKDKHTAIDVYGYYPFTAISDVSAHEFEVRKDQNTETNEEGLGGYEASDFLWGKATNVAPTENVIRLPLKHRMSRITKKAAIPERNAAFFASCRLFVNFGPIIKEYTYENQI